MKLSSIILLNFLDAKKTFCHDDGHFLDPDFDPILSPFLVSSFLLFLIFLSDCLRSSPCKTEEAPSLVLCTSRDFLFVMFLQLAFFEAEEDVVDEVEMGSNEQVRKRLLLLRMAEEKRSMEELLLKQLEILEADSAFVLHIVDDWHAMYEYSTKTQSLSLSFFMA